MSEDVFATTSTQSAEEAHVVRKDNRVPPWLLNVAVWVGWANLWTELRIRGQPSVALGWSTILASQSMNAALWAALTPLVVRFARRAAVFGPRSKRFVIAHVCGAIIAGVGHTGLWIGALYVFDSSDLGPAIQSMFGWMIWDAGAYAAIVAFTTFFALSERIRDARVIMARKRARLAEAKLAALRLRLQPRILIGALDALERVVSIDAERAEAAIARMGDLLRLLLNHAEDESVEVDEEVELLIAYVDVVTAWRLIAGNAHTRVVIERGTERIPAMSLLTMAASMGGAPDEISIRLIDEMIVVDASASDNVVDETAVAELSDRLAELYHGKERLVSGRDPFGAAFIHIEIPASKDASLDVVSAYGLASA